MREILFRGKTKNGEWLEWTLLGALLANPRITTEIELKTVGTYTGLKDRNGKKIFEGDIVEYREEYGAVEYHDQEAMYFVCFDGWLTDFDHIYGKEVEIIGNIHDNPELLEE